jgi:hypothetical protein
MPSRRLKLSGLILILCGVMAAGQNELQTGALEVVGRVKIDNKQEKLSRKRFYILPGGLKENRALLDRVKTAEITSRDCYYAKAQASPELVCWLQAENCESPYCRRIEQPDVEKVPEFKTAYQKGLTQFARKPDLARLWLTTNLSPIFANGYYKEQQTLLKRTLGDARPVQSTMTDSTTVKAIFIDLPLAGAKGKFTISNILPIEIGGKSYVWSCEMDVTAEKRAIVKLPDAGKTVKNCEVVIKDLAVCKSAACTQK